jgi:hypothetical protein
MNKVYYLSETEWRSLIVDILDDLGYDDIKMDNIEQIASYLQDMVDSEGLDGMVVWYRGDLIELWGFESILKFLERYYRVRK